MARRLFTVLVAGSLMLGGIGAGVAGATPAATHTSCTTFAGSGKIVPPLSATPKPTTITIKATLSGCTGGGVTSGTVNGSLKSPNLSCGTGGANPAGSLTIKWNTGRTSTAKVTAAMPSRGNLVFGGKVTAGLFVGDTVAGPVRITGTTGNCTSTPISAFTFSGKAKV